VEILLEDMLIELPLIHYLGGARMSHAGIFPASIVFDFL